jgi:hypothetical protein
VYSSENKATSRRQRSDIAPYVLSDLRGRAIAQNALGVHTPAPKDQIASKLPFQFGQIHTFGADLHRVENVYARVNEIA